METPIRVLILEDSKIWAQMMVEQLERDEFQVTYEVVSGEKDFKEKINSADYDLILADYNLPQWNAELAYEALKNSGKNIPFIIVSGSIGEEKTVELLKMGIDDMVLKENSFRLAASIRKTFHEYELKNRERRTKEKLEQSELKFRGILEQSDLAIFGFDHDGNILFWSRCCKDFFGYDAEQMLGKNIRILEPEEPEEKIMRRLKSIFQGESGCEKYWETSVDENKKRYVHTVYSGVKDVSGRVVFGVSASMDITERQSLEDQLIQVEKMEAIGQLAGGIAHDFNNQLTVIIGNLNLALKKIEGNHPACDLMQEAGKAAEQCVFTIKGLLSLGRKSKEIQKSTVDFHSFLDDFEKFIHHLLPATIKFEFRKNADRFLVNMNGPQIQQVLVNLSVNARDAMPGGGVLLIETHNTYFDEDYANKIKGMMPGQFLCVSVTDTGMGIPKDILPKIFEPFFTTKKPGEGTGLGLASTYGIMKSHGGWIRVYSECNRGTTFRLYFPVALGVEKFQPVKMDASVLGGNETVFVADDEEAIRNLAKAFLEQKGYTVILAKDGQELISIFRRENHHIDLLLVDLTMPHFMVDNALSEIRSMNPNVPVIISSGYSLSGSTGQEMLAKGATAFVQKPYNPEELCQVVRSVLDLRNNLQKSKQQAT